ncbi:MAG: D-2-hydroxyacid dehydrogenase [Litorilinea sp.]
MSASSPELTVIVGAEIGPDNLARLRRDFPNVVFHYCMEDAEWRAVAPEAQVIFSKGLPKGMQDNLPALRWVQAGTAGVDRWLQAGLPERGVLLSNSWGAHGDPISEQLLGHMLAFATGLHTLIRAQLAPPAERYQAKIHATETKFELNGQTLCVIGLGDIGGALARKASGLGMHVIGVRRSTQPAPGVAKLYPPEQLTTALAQADHVALCLPLTAETVHFMGTAELRAMSPTAYIYNVGRGASIEPDALIQALQRGEIAGAGLDVTDPEPLPADSPLWTMPNVILSQHTSGMSPHNANRITDIFAANLTRYLAGEPLQHRIDPVRGY